MESLLFGRLLPIQFERMPRKEKEKKNRQTLGWARKGKQINNNNDCCERSKWSEKATSTTSKLYAFSCCLIFSLWRLIESGWHKKVPTRFTSIVLTMNMLQRWQKRTQQDKNLRRCVSNKRDVACDSNEWHLFIPCHWLISYCFCFTIKIFTRSPFTRSYKFLSENLFCRARFEFVCDAKIK